MDKITTTRRQRNCALCFILSPALIRRVQYSIFNIISPPTAWRNLCCGKVSCHGNGARNSADLTPRECNSHLDVISNPIRSTAVAQVSALSLHKHPSTLQQIFPPPLYILLFFYFSCRSSGNLIPRPPEHKENCF